MSIAAGPGSQLERPPSSGLSEIVGMILDKGLVIDAFVRVSLVGIEVLTIEAKVVVASIDTYLRYAEAMARLNVAQVAAPVQAETVSGIVESVAQGVTKGALDAVQQGIEGTVQNVGSVPVAGSVIDEHGLLQRPESREALR